MVREAPYGSNKVTAYPTVMLRNAVNRDDKKRRVNSLRFIAKDTLDTVVDARWWVSRSRGSVVYCSVWVSPPLDSPLPLTTGRGSAGGGGYHKESAALEEAFADAGIQFEKHFNGCGDAAMIEAIKAVGAYLGVEGRAI